jgi:hypothetical protein
MSAPAAYGESYQIIQKGGSASGGRENMAMSELVPAPDTSSWYQTQYGCLPWDPTLVARRHTFPDAVLPRGKPEDPAAAARICLSYRNAWPMTAADASAMVEAERNHPQFAFNGGGPGTARQVEMESYLRRLDYPLGNCQPVIGMEAPLFQNAVAPPAPINVPAAVQNAANPVAAIVAHPDECRAAADAVASAMSGRWADNPTRYDTRRFVVPFAPPGIGTGAARGPGDAGTARWA